MSYYDLLGVPADADEETLQKVIAQQAAQWSKRSSNAASMESRHQAELKLQAIQEARQVLLKPEKRAEYDQSLPSLKASSAGSKGSGPLEPEDRMPCPYCLESIHRNAKKCRWCNEWLDPSAKKDAPTPAPQRAPSVELTPPPPPPPAPKPAAVVPVVAEPVRAPQVERPLPITPAVLVGAPTRKRKSRGGAAVLAFLGGPFGLFYVGAGHGWGAVMLWFFFCVISSGVAGVLSWMFGVFSIWAWIATEGYNKKHGHPR
jgi:hypothetical protein